MTLEARTAALLALVEADRTSRCAALAADAAARNGALLAQAHSDARRRVHDAFVDERQRAATRIAAAQADLATRRRRHDQQRAALLVAQGLARLPDALRARWRDPARRAAWVDAAVAWATRSLPPTQWRIAHPVAWPADERDALASRLASTLAASPAFAADAGLDAGLRIAAAGNVIDGSLAGVLADRTALGSRLLRLLEESP